MEIEAAAAEVMKIGKVDRAALLETLAVHLMEFLFPWIYTGNCSLYLVNKHIYAEWKKYETSLRGEMKSFHPRQWLSPLYKNMELLSENVRQTIIESATKDKNTETMNYLSFSLDCYVSSRYYLSFTKHMLTKLVNSFMWPKSSRFSLRQWQMWTYHAVYRFCRNFTRTSFAENLYFLVTREFFPQWMKRVHAQLMAKTDLPVQRFLYMCRAYLSFSKLILPAVSHVNRYLAFFLEANVTVRDCFQLFFRERVLKPYKKQLSNFDEQFAKAMDDVPAFERHYFRELAADFFEDAAPLSFAKIMGFSNVEEPLSLPSKVTIFSKDVESCIHADHPIMRQSLFLKEFFESRFFRRCSQEVTLYVPFWCPKVLDFAVHFDKEPMREIMEYPKNVLLADVVEPYYAQFAEDIDFSNLPAYFNLAHMLGLTPLIKLIDLKINLLCFND